MRSVYTSVRVGCETDWHGPGTTPLVGYSAAMAYDEKFDELIGAADAPRFE